jgi:hypothetical protein
MSYFKLFTCLIALMTVFFIAPYGGENVAEGASNIAKWQQAAIPAQGAENGWLLASGSDITCLAADNNGIFYASVSGMPSNLYKSADEGENWQAIGSGSDVIVDMVTAADNTLYFATADNIYKYVDDSNTMVGTITGRFANPDTVISSIDVSQYQGKDAILVGTKNQNGGQFGGIYLIYCDVLMQWQDLGLEGCDVYSVAFSPRFTDDNSIVAMASDENDSFITWKEGSGEWEGTIGNALFKDDSTGNPILVTETAVIAFPNDYCSDGSSGNCVLYAALDSGTNDGDVYIVYGRNKPEQSVAEDLNIAAAYGLDNVDITCFDLCGTIGDISMMAGTAGGNRIFISSESGGSWQQSSKSPSGDELTALVLSDDYKNNGKAFCATMGNNSAFSVSLDRGINWNQCGLIDTTVDIIVEAAVSPGYDFDETLFLLTWGNEYSVWRSSDGCKSWQRVFCGSPGSFTSIDKIALSPQYGNESRVLYFCGSEDGNPRLWKSTDNGQSFITRNMPFTVDLWEIIDDASFFIAEFDGSNARLHRTVDSGAHYKYKSVVGNRALTSIALSPHYSSDKTLLAGNCSGDVFLSTDEGTTFTPLGNLSSPLSGNISAAFDAGFKRNGIVYAADDIPGNGIYRFTIGESSTWEAIDDTLPVDAMIGDLGVSAGGVLYGINYQLVNAGGSIERCLNPASSHFFESFAGGLYDDTLLTGIWLGGNIVWSIDTTNNLLFYFKDTLSQQVALSSPVNRSVVKGTLAASNIKNIALSWKSLEGASAYRWQLSDSESFSASSVIAEDTTTSNSVKLVPLEAGSIYYWRVKATTPLASPWSDTWSFTPQPVTELDAPILESPSAGALNVPVNTLFQWTAVNGAQGYELEIATRTDFNNPVVRLAGADAIPVNAWQNQQSFTHNTTYYWRVRAISPDATSGWSAAGIFATIAAETIQTTTSSSSTAAESTGILQTQSTQSLASFTTVEVVSTAVFTEFPTITIIQTSQSTAQLQQPQAIPDWLCYMLGFMAILIVVLLATILIIVVKRH